LYSVRPVSRSEGGNAIKIVASIPKADIEIDSRLVTEGWNRLKEPKNVIYAILLSVPLMAVNFIITALIAKLIAPVQLAQLLTFSDSLSISVNLLDIIGLVALLVVHEILHLVLIPNFFRSDKTYAGITYAGAFVVTEEVLTRRRFAIISIAPFVVLSIMLPLAAGATGMLNQGLLFLILLNAICSSVDMLSLLLVLTHVPRGARIMCNGWNTYWKSG
jgi:hypothetical protein